jgi:Rrf2 family transcriptional regulator, cysteine metabolism repressor
MRLSRASQYALLAMIQLSPNPQTPPIPCSQLAKAGMPERFLLQVMRQLVNARLLKSTRGVDGGYRLAKPLTEISIADVVAVIDGPLQAESPLVLGALPKKAFQRVTVALENCAFDVNAALGKVKLSSLAA